MLRRYIRSITPRFTQQDSPSQPTPGPHEGLTPARQPSALDCHRTSAPPNNQGKPAHHHAAPTRNGKQPLQLLTPKRQAPCVRKRAARLHASSAATAPSNPIQQERSTMHTCSVLATVLSLCTRSPCCLACHAHQLDSRLTPGPIVCGSGYEGHICRHWRRKVTPPGTEHPPPHALSTSLTVIECP